MKNTRVVFEIKEYLKSNLKPKRYIHTIGVSKTACLIGKNNNLNIEKLYLSGLLHDISKSQSLDTLKEHCTKHNIPFDDIEGKSHGLLHAKVSAILAKELYFIKDPNILDPIRSHTTGRANMSPYEEVIFVSDFCEPSRKLKVSKDIIKKSFSNLKSAVFDVISNKLEYLIANGMVVHPKSIDVYNYYRLYKI